MDAAKNPFLPEINLTVDKLPSKGLPYPDKCAIKYRPYVYGELVKIAESKLSEQESIKLVLDGIECSFDKLELTVQDYLYIGLLRKISTINGDQYIVKYTCDKCGTDGNYMFESRDLEFQDLVVNELPIKFEFNQVSLEFTPITLSKYLKLLAEENQDDDMYWMAAQCKNYELEEARNLIYALPPELGSKVEKIDALLFHGLKQVKKPCKKCGNLIASALEAANTVILPFRERKGTTGNAVRAVA